MGRLRALDTAGFCCFVLPNKSETEAVPRFARGRFWSLAGAGAPAPGGPLGGLCAVLHGVGSSAQRCNKFKKN